MEIKISNTIIALVLGDITKEETDAIVNAANSGLKGGGGVDGAIHRAGGPSIMKECRKIGHCPTGQAVVTGGGNLKAGYVIHTVGPVYRGGNRGEADLLKSAYLESLKKVTQKGLRSVSFPAISAGIYGYPPGEAASIALKTAIDYVRDHEEIELVRFVLFSQDIYDVFSDELKKLGDYLRS
ncbi:MAG: O-acetyl-ADP-ribose deacetylase [Deltaproteobacteria bacterium]|nr:O-acetyl-ADP-ribose deacetylase [Deltaproteobacteria bacterium]